MNITKHVKDRFRQRAKLFLHKHELADIESTMISFISSGRKSLSLSQCPFYRNKIGCDKIIYGRFHFYVKNDSVVTFVLQTKENKDQWRF